MTAMLRAASDAEASGVRRLSGAAGSPDFRALRELLRQDAVGQCYLADRIAGNRLESAAVGGPIWGYFADGELVAALFRGANLTGVRIDAEACAALVPAVLADPGVCSAIVGHAEQMLPIWDALEFEWGPARDVRADQPLMAISAEPSVAGAGRVAVAGRDEVGDIVPAAIHMFTAEVGVSPIVPGREASSAAAFRGRLASLVRQRRVFIARDDAGTVIFKAEVAAMAQGVGQVQGVWLHPDLRGRGLAAGHMADVVRLVRRTLCPTVSLYVNSYNAAALATYRRVGFEQVGTFATVHL